MIRSFTNHLIACAFFLITSSLFSQDCSNYKLYYTHDPQPNGQYDLFEVELDDTGNANLTLLAEQIGGAHIALSPDGSQIYSISSKLRIYDVATGVLSDPITIQTADGTILTGFPSAVCDADGVLYGGNQGQNQVYTIGLDGIAEPFGPSVSVSGGDLIFVGDDLLSINRSTNTFTKVLTGETFSVDVNQINGAAVLPNGNVLVADGNGESLFKEIDLATTAVVNTYDSGLNLNNGDFAGGCIGGDGFQTCDEYAIYLMNNPEQGGSMLYKVNVVGSNAIIELEAEFAHGGHIALNEDGELYIFGAVSGKYITYDPSTGSSSDQIQVTFNGNAVNGIPQAVFDPSSGKIIVASVVDEAVYEVDPATGEAELITLTTVSGGDLVITQDGNLWIINRVDDVFVNLTDGTSSFEPGLDEINGAALLEDGRIIVSNAGSTELNLIDPTTGMVLDLAFPLDFELRNGDMASGCIGGFTFENECEDFRYFYIADNTSGFAQGTVFEGEISGGDFVLTQLFEAGISAHLAVNTQDGLFYVVNGNVLRTYSYSGLLINEVSTGAIGGITAAVYNSNDGLVYVGDAPGNEVWSVDPATGDQTLFADEVPVQGGDLFFSEEGGLYILERINNNSSKVYEIILGEAVLVSDIVNSVNGGASTFENGFIVAEGNNSNSFYTYDLDGGNEVELTALLNGELFSVVDGDMASGCFDNTEFVEPQISAEVVNEIGKISTYPNPSLGDSNVNFEVLEDGFTSIELIDMTGTVQQVVFSQKAYAGEQYNIQINATDIPDGIYIYKLTTIRGVVSTKLMMSRK